MAGTYRLRASKSGYPDWQRDVMIAADQQSDVMIAVEPTPEPIVKGKDGAEMVLIPASAFWMGSDAAEVTRVKEEMSAELPGREVQRVLRPRSGSASRRHRRGLYRPVRRYERSFRTLCPFKQE
jgi:hypothetical protein